MHIRMYGMVKTNDEDEFPLTIRTKLERARTIERDRPMHVGCAP